MIYTHKKYFCTSMKIIDKYIIKKFFLTFFFSIVAMTILVVIVDLSEKTDDFAKTGLSAKEIVTQYYFGFVPHIDAMLFPLFLFISVIFFYFQDGQPNGNSGHTKLGYQLPEVLIALFLGRHLFYIDALECKPLCIAACQ